MASEIVVPGMITFFLGLSALVVALGYKTGLLEGILSGFTGWFITSLFSVFVLREFAKKLLPGDFYKKLFNEDLDAFGAVVEVVEEVNAANTRGRIRFRGTTWKATTGTGSISAGCRAKIVARDNLVWIVEPCDELLLDQTDPETDS